MSVDYSALAAMYDSAGALQAKQISNTYKLGKDEIKARLKIAAQSSKDTRYGIDAERDTAREQIEQARAEMERIGIPDMEIRRFVAESNKALAEAELGLKREIFLTESGLARDQLNKDIREMEEIGIPRVEIERYTAQKNAEIQQAELAQRERQFNTTASGYMQARPQLTPTQQQRYNQIQATDEQLKAQGQPGIEGADLVELQQYENVLAGGQAQGQAAAYGAQDRANGLAPPEGVGGGQRTLEGEELDRQYQLDVQRFGADEAERRRVENERQRRYALDVSQFGAQLASTPDTYYQSRRFQGVDVPRLMGGAGAATQDVQGGPTPGVATMGAYLGGQDPYGGAGGATPYGGPNAGAPQPAAPGTLGLPGTPEDDRAKQVAKIAALSPPSPYDGLNEQDTNTLKLMESIYKRGGQGIAGGEYERLKASGRLGYLQSAGKLLGYSPSDLENQYQSYRPTQESSRLA